MEHILLAASPRTRGTKGKLGALRRDGRVPGILYGLNSEPILLEVKASDLRTILPKRNHVVEIQLEGQKYPTMVKVTERDPIRRDVIHIDFLLVDEVHPVTVSVPVLTTGIPIGVKSQGGVFSVAKKFVRLRSKVSDIPENFTIDVSDLVSGKTFYVRDLKFEQGTLVTPGRTALFGVGTGHREEEATPAPGAATAPAAATAATAAKPAAKPAGKTAAPADAKAAGAAKPAAKKTSK